MDEDQNDVPQSDASDITPETPSTSGQETETEIETDEVEIEAKPQESSEPRSQTRIKQLLDKHRQAEARAEAAERRLQSLSGAQSLHERLSKNPKHLQRVMEMLGEKEAAEVEDTTPQEELFDGYDPNDPVIKTVKQLHRDNMELKKLVNDFKSFKDNQVKSSVEQHQAEIDDYFDSKLIQEGFLGADRQPTATSHLMQKLVLAELASMELDNPDRPTRAQVDAAYKNALNGLSHFEKHKLTKAIKPQQVPPTGSKKGVAPGKVASSKMTDEERQAKLASAFS